MNRTTLLLATTSFALGLMGAVITPPAAAEDRFQPVYSAQGLLRYTFTATNRTLNQSQEYGFEVCEGADGVWAIDVHTRSPDPKLPVETTEHIGYDKADVYSILQSPHVLRFSLGAPPVLVPAGVGNDSAATIGAGPYPLDRGAAVGVLWLAFFGGTQLAPSPTGSARLPNLTVDARHDPLAWCCDFQFKVLQSRFHPVIESGRYEFNPRYFRGLSSDYQELDEPSGEVEAEMMAKKFRLCTALQPTQYVRAQYSTEGLTNFNGMLLPLRFHCEGPSQEATGFTYDGMVTNLSIPAQREVRPLLKGGVYVQDRRLRSKENDEFRPGVSYPLPNDKWITSKEDALIRAAAAETRPVRMPGSSGRKATHTRLTIAIILLAACPMVIAVWKRLARAAA